MLTSLTGRLRIAFNLRHHSLAVTQGTWQHHLSLDLHLADDKEERVGRGKSCGPLSTVVKMVCNRGVIYF